MAARIRADPDIGIGRRNGQRTDAADFPFAVDALALRIEIHESAMAAFSRIATARVVDIAQPPRKLARQRLARASNPLGDLDQWLLHWPSPPPAPALFARTPAIDMPPVSIDLTGIVLAL
jgi:hypothetical protein